MCEKRSKQAFPYHLNAGSIGCACIPEDILRRTTSVRKEEGNGGTYMDDNRGNRSSTTKFPACAVLMEVSGHMKRVSMKVEVEWTIRAGNREADPGTCLQRNVKRRERRPDERMRLKDPW